MPTAIKICGVTRVQDALAAAHSGAQAIGMVLYSKSPRVIDFIQAARIVRSLPPFVTPVALLVDPTAEFVERVIADVGPALLQFHGDEDPDFCGSFGFPYVKAIRVRPDVDLLQCARAYGGAKGLLLDAFVDGARGGTGTTFDWSLIPQEFPLPIILAGGLDPRLVTEAIQRVRPWAVDVSSGVESEPGKKDAVKIAAFIQGVKDADV